MRKYTTKVSETGDEWDDLYYELKESDTTESIREEYYFHSDEPCYWAKIIEGNIFYSKDDVFNSEKEDATHIVYFLK